MAQHDNLFEQYMKDVTRYSRISPEREVELSRIILHTRSKKKVEAAVHELVQGNLLLVVHCAKEFSRFLGPSTNSIGLMDLIAEGNIALMKAARRFDAGHRSNTSKSKSAKPTRFSTYAYKSIQRAINRALKLSRFIHIPEHHFTYWSKMNRIQDAEGETVTDASMARTLDVPASQLKMLKQGLEVRTTALEDLYLDENSAHWSDKLPNNNAMTPDTETELKDLRSFLLTQMKCLPDRTNEMLSLLFFSDSKPTLEVLSKRFGVSSERCRQICARGLELMRTKLTSTLSGDQSAPALAFNAILMQAQFSDQERMTA